MASNNKPREGGKGIVMQSIKPKQIKSKSNSSLTPEPQSMLEHALFYGALDIKVFPCNPKNKNPLVPRNKDANGNPIDGTGGFKKASSNPDIIRAWWKKFPRAMIGCATGSASGFWAVDPDTQKLTKGINGKPDTWSPNGVAAWNNLLAEHGPHDPTIETTTPSDGHHICFRSDPDHPIGITEGDLSGCGINVRGDGGYVILPPSQRADGKSYIANKPFAFDHASLADAPAWLYELIGGRRKSKDVRTADGDDYFPFSDDNESYLRTALSFIPADDYLVWLRVGAALKNSLSEDWDDRGRDLWDEWSSTSNKFNLKEQNKKWKSFRSDHPNPATIGNVIFFEAGNHGWGQIAADGKYLSKVARDIRKNDELLDAMPWKDFCLHWGLTPRDPDIRRKSVADAREDTRPVAPLQLKNASGSYDKKPAETIAISDPPTKMDDFLGDSETPESESDSRDCPPAENERLSPDSEPLPSGDPDKDELPPVDAPIDATVDNVFNLPIHYVPHYTHWPDMSDAAPPSVEDAPEANAPPKNEPHARANGGDVAQADAPEHLPPANGEDTSAVSEDTSEAAVEPKPKMLKKEDFIKDGGPGYAYKNEQERQADVQEWQSEQQKRLGIKTLADLQFMKFPELKILVPDLLVEGCTLLAGRPKVGKSWMALAIAIAVATGGKCFIDKECMQGDVLYLALEDGERRLQKRVTKLLGIYKVDWPKELSYVTSWRKADAGGVKQIEVWLKEHPAARLVVVDVLARFRSPPPDRSKEGAYQQDYNALVVLQELATRCSVSVIIVDHTRKASGEDAVDDVSGTLGKTGAVDAFIVLKNSESGKLMIGRGRDIEEFEHAVKFNSDTCQWEILGAPKDVFASDNRKKILDVLEAATGPMEEKDIKEETGLSRDVVNGMLRRLTKDGKIEKVGRGQYKIIVRKVDDEDTPF